MKCVKLPTVAYEFDFYKDFTAVSFFPRQDAPDGSMRTIKLPAWLSKAMRDSISVAYLKGIQDSKKEIRSVIGCDS